MFSSTRRKCAYQQLLAAVKRERTKVDCENPLPNVKAVLQAGDVGGAGALGGLFDIEFDVCAFFEVRTANVFHVEENVIVRVVRRNETVAACVVEEINVSFRHCNSRKAPDTYNSCVTVFVSKQK